jgi:ABC-type polysaccharide/polyol phosphate export permease
MVFFLTPILYKRTFVNESILGYIVYINPLTYLIGNISMSLSTESPLMHDFLMALSLALGNLAIGVLVYFKYHKNISQVL